MQGLSSSIKLSALMLPKGENLVRYYILPLVSINTRALARTFKGSFISKVDDDRGLYLKLSKEATVLKSCNTEYICTIKQNNCVYMRFDIPERFTEDVNLFRRGLYSQMKASTKKVIYRSSGLAYNKRMSDFKVTHPLLHALDKTKTLRTFLKEELGVDELSGSGELVDAPRDTWFIETEFNIK